MADLLSPLVSGGADPGFVALGTGVLFCLLTVATKGLHKFSLFIHEKGSLE